MPFTPTFELARRHTAAALSFRPVAIDFETGEKVLPVGIIDGEDQNAADIFAYADGQRTIPFIFGDYWDFSSFGEARGFKPPMTSAFLTWVGGDISAIKNHLPSRSTFYDRDVFGGAGPAYAFSGQAEYERIVERIRTFLPSWLFFQIARQTSKSSIRTLVFRQYWPSICIEVLAPDVPWGAPTPKEWRARVGAKNYVLYLSSYRKALLDHAALLTKREEIKKTSPAEPRNENKSPWGGSYVHGIEADYQATLVRANAEAERLVSQFTSSRISTAEEFATAVESIKAPYRMEKFIKALLDCETPPTDRNFEPLICVNYEEQKYLWSEVSKRFLASFAAEEGKFLDLSYEETFVRITATMARRADNKSRLYWLSVKERMPPQSQTLVDFH